MLYCLRQTERDLGRLTPGESLTRPERILGRIRAELEFCDVHELLAEGLQPYLDRVQEAVREASEAIGQQYFRNLLVDLHPIELRQPAEGS